MARRTPPQVRPTVLIVGEGFAEVAFLGHVRSLYTASREGCRLTIGNARGWGAGHVVKHTIAQAGQASFDRVAALLDTDTDWTNATKTAAKRHRITVLASEPCLEGWLLRLQGQSVPQGQGTAALKQRFTDHFGAAAHEASLYPRHFPREKLDRAAQDDPTLRELLDLLLKW